MFEQSTEYDIKEGFTKSIVDSKERTKRIQKRFCDGYHLISFIIAKTVLSLYIFFDMRLAPDVDI